MKGLFTLLGGASSLALAVGATTIAEYIPPAAAVATIVLDRTAQQIAPDPVRFSVSFDDPDHFQTTTTYSHRDDANTPNAGYNPRDAELDYEWTFGDTGVWTRLTRYLSATWRDKNVGYGAKPEHVYQTGGEKSAAVLITERSSGLSAIADITFNVGDPDAAYLNTNTLCVNPLGDADFSAAPTGAATHNADAIDKNDATIEAARAAGKRILLKKGATGYSMSFAWASGDVGHINIGSYGTGVNPQVFVTVDGSTGFFSRAMNIQGSFTSTKRDCRIYDIDFFGNFDPTSEDANDFGSDTKSASILRADCPLDICISNVSSKGVLFSHYYFAPNGSSVSPTNPGEVAHFALVDSQTTEYGILYPIFFGPFDDTVNGSVSLVGWDGNDHPNSADFYLSDFVGDPPKEGSDSILRVNYVPNTYIAQSMCYQSQKGTGLLNLCMTPQADGTHTYIWGLFAEGREIAFGSNQFQGFGAPTAHTITMRSCYYMGLYQSNRGISILLGGVTIENCCYVLPACPDITGEGIGPFAGVFYLQTSGGNTPSAGALDAPIRIRNNTVVTDRTWVNSASQGLRVSTTEYDNGSFTNAVIEDLVEQGEWENTGDTDPAAPLDETVLGFEALCPGRRNPNDFVLEGEWAPPAGTPRSFIPLATSAAEDGTVSLKPAPRRDILLNLRDATPEAGAWEKAAA